MPELGAFAQIAPYLTHPLVLAGFALLLCFGLLRAVLKSRVMPTVSQSAGGRALLALLRYGFVLALVVIVLGFALVFYQTERTTVDADEIIRDFEAATEKAAASESTSRPSRASRSCRTATHCALQSSPSSGKAAAPTRRAASIMRSSCCGKARPQRPKRLSPRFSTAGCASARPPARKRRKLRETSARWRI